jgi:hypothetical protein
LRGKLFYLIFEISNKKTDMKKTFKYLGYFMIGSLVIGGISAAFSSPEEKTKQEQEQTIAEQKERDEAYKEKRIYECYAVTQSAIKNSLKDPKSYDEVSQSHGYVNDSTIQVVITYRATNSFGAYLQKKRVAKFGISKADGLKLIETFEN